MLLSSGIWSVLQDPKALAIVSHLGFLLALIGFPITIWQLFRTKRSADAAQAAAEAARVRLTHLSALRGCEQARLHSRSITQAIASENWPGVLLSYRNLSETVTDLIESNVAFDEEVKSVLCTGLEIIERNMIALDRAVHSNKLSPTPGKELTALKKLDPILAKALSNLERLAS